MPQQLRLISHKLCPYVQRAVIVATEKGIPFERVDIDLADKPDWFLALSPTGKVPVLEVTDDNGARHILFESAVIAEYLDELGDKRLLPADPLRRARERAWVEFASAALGDIYRLETAKEESEFDSARKQLRARLEQVEKEIAGPWFSGASFGLVDAAFAPVFRYLTHFEQDAGLKLLDGLPKAKDWGRSLLERTSVRKAVPADYRERLLQFIRDSQSHFATLIGERALEAA